MTATTTEPLESDRAKRKRLRRELDEARRALRINPTDPQVREAHADAIGAWVTANPTRITRERREFAATLDQRTGLGGWVPLTFPERLVLNPLLHEVIFAVTKWTGMRDRLRCPKCTAVGTFKPHGALWKRVKSGDITLRRWGCKTCGYWLAKGTVDGVRYDGRTWAFPAAEDGVWRFPDPQIPRTPTPFERLHEWKVWPWTG